MTQPQPTASIEFRLRKTVAAAAALLHLHAGTSVEQIEGMLLDDLIAVFKATPASMMLLARLIEKEFDITVPAGREFEWKSIEELHGALCFMLLPDPCAPPRHR